MKKLNKMLTACGSHMMKLALSLTLVAAMSTGAYADCQLNCNQNVQVSLDGDCEATITYKTMLQDPDNPAICTPNGPSAYVVQVMAADGTVLGDKISKSNLQDGWCGVSYLVKVKHWATGNICWGSIYVEDKLAPKGEAKDFAIDCYENPPSLQDAFKNYAQIYDNCEHAEVVDGAITAASDDCDPYLLSQGYCGKFEYKYTVADKCGNTAIFSHYMYVRDVAPKYPKDVEQKCNEENTHPSVTGYPTIGGISIIPGNLVGYCKWGTSYEDWVVDVCKAGNDKQIIRTWKLVNKCTGDLLVHKQTIDVVNAGPWVDPLPEESLWLGTNNGSHTCDYYGLLPVPRYRAECAPITQVLATVYTYDADKGYQHPTPVVSGVNVLAGQTVRIAQGGFKVVYDFFDECHAKTQRSYYGYVYDATQPVAIADTYTTLDLASAGFDDNDCVTSLHAYDLDSGSYDNCRGVTLEVARKDADGTIGEFGHKVNFTTADACAEHLVVLRVCEDQNGKQGKDEVLCSEVWIKVEVQDSYLAFEQLLDKKIACSGDDEWNAEDAFDTPRLVGCTAEIIDITDEASPANCGKGYYKRTWTAKNCKGIEATVSQKIEVYYEGTIDFACPKDFDFDCGDGYTADSFTADVTGAPTITTTGCAFASVSEPHDEVFRHEGEGDGCFKIKRSWSIIDWCDGGSYVGSCYQTISVTDKIQPVVTCDDVDVCITDGCDATFTVPAPNVDDCTATTVTVAWEFNGKDGAVSAGSASVGQSVTFGPGVLTLKYIARDACGNFGNATCDVTITDCKDPTPYCRDIGTAIMNNGMIEIWASDFLLYAEDNCDSKAMVEATVKMRITGTDDTPSANLTLTCDDLSFSGGFAVANVDIIVYDWAGNSDFCTTTFLIQDNSDNCSGSGGAAAAIVAKFNNEAGESVENVSVKLSGGAMNLSQMTTASGTAQFSNVPMSGDYEVAGEKDMNYMNGVSTKDVVFLTRHILGIDKLDSPYKLIAADVNGSNKISTGDVLALRKVILGITDDFGGNTSWRFVDAKYIFPNPTNPFEATFPEKLNVSNLDHDMTADFVSVKIGDIDGSAKANELLGSPSFEGSSLVVGLEDRQLVAGKTYDVAFQAKDFNHFGYQFTLGFDKNAISVNGVTPGVLEGLSQNNFGMQLLDQGAITTSWDNANGVQLDDNNTIFTMSITATANTRLSEVLNINSTITAAEAVNGDLEATDVELTFFNRTSAQFELFQNTPNPFNGETLIEFSIPEADQVTFQVFDVSGKVLMERTQNLNRGTHQIRLSKNDLGATGVLYYQVETSRDVATKKMITIE